MKTLDDMLSASMADMAVRNDAVFESTRRQVIAMMGRGGLSWPWITSVGVLVVAGATWFALRTSSVETVVVKPIVQTTEQRMLQPTVSAESKPASTPPSSNHGVEVHQNVNALQAKVDANDTELVRIFDSEMKKATEAIQHGDRVLARKIYTDLARTMRLNADERRAYIAETKAVSLDK